MYTVQYGRPNSTVVIFFVAILYFKFFKHSSLNTGFFREVRIERPKFSFETGRAQNFTVCVVAIHESGIIRTMDEGSKG
jgi:hypothetical protein